MKQQLLCALALLCLGATPAMSQKETIDLKVIETSDVHGHFFPYDFIEGRELRGTLARASTYINRQRQQYGDRLLLLDNGDILQGQPCTYWSNYVATGEENLAASVVNYMGYDVEAVGNHDVETGHKVYDKWISEVRCPVVGANIVDTASQLPYVKPYALIEREIKPQTSNLKSQTSNHKDCRPRHAHAHHPLLAQRAPMAGAGVPGDGGLCQAMGAPLAAGGAPRPHRGPFPQRV